MYFFKCILCTVCCVAISSAFAQQAKQQQLVNYRQTQQHKEAFRYRYASFPDLDDYISEHLEYPALARDQSQEGNVTVRFKIDTTGKVSEARIIQSLGFGCDEAALKCVSGMPGWQPATLDGRPVASFKVVQLRFRLY